MTDYEGPRMEQERSRLAGPRLTALFKEYEFGSRSAMPNAALGISKLGESNLTVSNVLYEPEVAETISQTAILAYLEELAQDGIDQESPVDVKKQMAKITGNSNDQATERILVREDSAGITERLPALADEFAEHGRRRLSVTDMPDPATKKKLSRLFAPVDRSWSAVPRAFTIIRFGLMRFGSQPIIESQSTKQLGNHVTTLLKEVITAEAPADTQIPPKRSR